MKKVLIFFGLVLLILNCTNNKPMPNGYELIERDNKIGLMMPVTLHPVAMARYWEEPATGSGTTLLIGETRDVSASILLKCRNLIKVDTTQSLVSATLKLYGSYLFGDDSTMSVTLHKVNEDWSEYTVLSSDVDGTWDPTPLEQTEITFHQDDWTELPLNLDFMKEWIIDSYQSDQTIQGLLIKSVTPSVAAEFVSADASGSQPFIQVVTQNSESGNDTTYAYLSSDASLLTNESTVEEKTLETDPHTLRVGNASGYASLIKFDVSAIPDSATIHKALLTFYIDRENSLTKTEDGMTLSAARLISDSLWAPEAVLSDTLTSAALDVASAENETFAFDGATATNSLSQIVQQWVSVDGAVNSGLLIAPQYPGSDFQEMSFRTGVDDSLFAPTLVITYALPPSHRFAE